MLYQRSKTKDILSDKSKINAVVFETISKMAEIVGATLGPGGRSVLLERDGMPPLATKDGVTVAKALGLADPEANIIIDTAKEICLQTAKQAGDGTTTAIVLASAFIEEGHKFLSSNPRHNPQRLINELQQCYKTVIVPFLKEKAVPADTEDMLHQVATISANGDKDVASAVVEAVMAAGEDGQVLVEEGQNGDLKVENIDGYIITTGLKDIGQLGPIFINDKANQQAKMEKGMLFLYDGSISDLKVTSKIQEAIEGTDLYGSPLILLAHDFSDVVLETLAKNVKGGFSIAPLKTPRSGLPNGRSLFLQDMAAYSGAMVFDPGNIDQLDADGFGWFDRAKANMYETVITCTVDHAKIEQRIEELKSIGDAAFSDADKMHIRASISKLTCGVSTIWVGGASDLEIREKKARVEDAVEAVRAAITEGVVPGGCAMHLTLSKLLSKHPAFLPSWNIMVEVLKKPFSLLLSNCGEDVKDTMARLDPYIDGVNLPTFIFDAEQHKIVMPFDAGIIEPTKVVRVSLGNALSVASLLMTLGGIVVCPRNSDLEAQLEMSKETFKQMMAAGGQE